jgi:hypothetical protein
MKWPLIALVGGAVFIGSPVAYADQQETEVHVHLTIPLDKGKTEVSGGGSYSNTNAGGTTKVEANTNGKKVDVNASHTQQHR